jgi:hypothetical protein
MIMVQLCQRSPSQPGLMIARGGLVKLGACNCSRPYARDAYEEAPCGHMADHAADHFNCSPRLTKGAYLKTSRSVERIEVVAVRRAW